MQLQGSALVQASPLVLGSAIILGIAGQCMGKYRYVHCVHWQGGACAV